MADYDDRLADYATVPERIQAFREKYPDGSLQPLNPDRPYRLEEWGGKTWLIYIAAAYRDKYDRKPGVGMAQEEVPGRTPYTRDSELQNAETSAWGRAIVAALGADAKKSVASMEDVRNRQAAPPYEVPDPAWKRLGYDSQNDLENTVNIVGDQVKEARGTGAISPEDLDRWMNTYGNNKVALAAVPKDTLLEAATALETMADQAHEPPDSGKPEPKEGAHGYELWGRPELQEECRARNLPTSGNRARLVMQLRADDATHGRPSSAEPDERPF